MTRQPGRTPRATPGPATGTPCLACTRALDPIIPVEHRRCVGWMFTQSRTDLPMTPCACTVCWPGGRGRPPQPDPQVQARRIVIRGKTWNAVR